MKHLLVATALICFASPALAETTLLSKNVYRISQGVTFTLSNSGSSSYLMSWSDAGGSFSNVADPTLQLAVGQTYTFQQTTGGHPFVITDTSLPTDGTDGSYFRTTTSLDAITSAVLAPAADFTADPAPTSDAIVWTPGTDQIGNFFYTCAIAFHTGMTGRIEVYNASVSAEDESVGQLKSRYQD
jgi:hypothetical protein